MTLQRKQKALLAIGSGAVVLLVLLALPFRSWTRTTLVTAFSQLYYPKVSIIYGRSFSPINTELGEYNLTLVDASKQSVPRQGGGELQSYTPLHGCGRPSYDGIHETVTCQKVQEYIPTSPDEFKKQWPKHADEFIKFLDSQGWRKEYDDQPGLNMLLSGPQDRGQWLSYKKETGKVACTLQIAYNPPYPKFDQIWINEMCTRDVKYFGGY